MLTATSAQAPQEAPQLKSERQAYPAHDGIAPQPTPPHQLQPTRVLSAPAAAKQAPTRSTLELLIRGDIETLNRRLLQESLPDELQKLLLVSLFGLAIHGLLVGSVAASVDPAWLPGSPLVLAVSLPAALLLALGICLPSFYFYTQLAGLDAPLPQIAAQGLRTTATISVRLLGVLPFYGAFVLLSVLGIVEEVGPAAIKLGIALPFIVGLHGISILYRSFKHLLGELPITHVRRGAFLLRLVLAWAMVFSSVAPVAWWRIAQYFSEIF